LTDDITVQELLEVQAHISLPSPALVEKDFHIVKALAAIAALDTAPPRLVFGGGTAALSRAYPGLEQRADLHCGHCRADPAGCAS
jgi:hypothetical protein